MYKNKNFILKSIVTLMLCLSFAYFISNVNTAYAAESKELVSAKAKINHLTNSLKTNYLGLKNQAMWEKYIVQSRLLISNISFFESHEAEKLSIQVDKNECLVKALGRINHVEKSILPKSQGGYGNYLGIKNAETWRDYLKLASTELDSIDKTIFKTQYNELIGRMNKVSNVVNDIEIKYQVEYNKIFTQYLEAKKNVDVDKAKQLINEATKLGNCSRTDELKLKISSLINSTIYVNNYNDLVKALASDNSEIIVVNSNISILGDIKIKEETSLIIPKGITLDSGSSISNYGTIINNGDIKFYDGNLYNYESIENYSNMSLSCSTENYNVIINKGNIDIYSFFKNNNLIDNEGTLTNCKKIYSYITMYNYGTFKNKSKFINNDSFSNYGYLENTKPGLMINSGEFINNKMINNLGIFTNTGNFENKGEFKGNSIN